MCVGGSLRSSCVVIGCTYEAKDAHGSPWFNPMVLARISCFLKMCVYMWALGCNEKGERADKVVHRLECLAYVRLYRSYKVFI